MAREVDGPGLETEGADIRQRDPRRLRIRCDTVDDPREHELLRVRGVAGDQHGLVVALDDHGRVAGSVPVRRDDADASVPGDGEALCERPDR